MLVGVLSAAVLVSAAAMAIAALALAVRPVWLLFGFEAVAGVGAVLGLLFARGRFQDGQGLAMACVGGTIGVASFLGWLAVRGTLPLASASVSLTPWLAARLGAAGLLAAVGAYAVLRRNAASLRYGVRAGATGGLLLVTAGVGVLLRHRLLAGIAGLPDPLGAIVWLLVAILGGVLICAAAHFTIRAFEMGREPPGN